MESAKSVAGFFVEMNVGHSAIVPGVEEFDEEVDRTGHGRRDSVWVIRWQPQGGGDRFLKFF